MKDPFYMDPQIVGFPSNKDPREKYTPNFRPYTLNPKP